MIGKSGSKMGSLVALLVIRSPLRVRVFCTIFHALRERRSVRAAATLRQIALEPRKKAAASRVTGAGTDKKRKIYKNFISPQLGFSGWIGPGTGGSISNERNPAWMQFIC
jgi:hypothetical protein